MKEQINKIEIEGESLALLCKEVIEQIRGDFPTASKYIEIIQSAFDNIYNKMMEEADCLEEQYQRSRIPSKQEIYDMRCDYEYEDRATIYL